MIERVARAIAAKSGWPDDMWDDPKAYSTSSIAKEAYAAFARAAIEAMREPDAQTIDAGESAFIFPSEGDRKSVSVRGSVSAVWQAMLSAALEQPHPVDEKEGI